MIWQRYLSLLVGSHARSATIIISVFLLGLALGYYVFGRVAEKVKDRHILLKIYGFVELATGAYAAIFPSLFKFFLDSPISQTNNFWIHLLLAALLLIPATFLMGATVPIMTTVLPESKENVNLIHSRIYGLNTLGAFLGTLVAGLYIIPQLGYDISLFLLGSLNVLVSLFYIKNNLSGPSYEKQKPEVLSHHFNQKLLYALGFVAGLTSLALEILWFRILGLTMGYSFVIFPFVLSIFILMIGLGSLTLKNINLQSFQKSMAYSLLFSLLTFLTVPYLPLFISHIRISFANHHLAFYLYHAFVYLVLLCVLSPAIFYLGRLLPFVYSMIQKDNKDYGLKVGHLYFFNTLGTFLGAVALGYLAFHIFGLKTIYLLSLSLLFILGLYFLKSRWVLQGLVLALALTTVLAPFSRKHHEKGLFRKRTPTNEHFKNIISQVNRQGRDKERRSYLKDGPNATVAVLDYTDDKGEVLSKSIIVNGKSDGNTQGDYGTTTLLSLIPYIATQGSDLKTMIIGIGTGVSAGVLASAQRVSQVDVVEISGAVIDSVEFMAPENFNFHKSSKTAIYKSDAFQFLKSVEDKYHIMVSEPPNPWVVGVENLYTAYFYELAKTRLTQDGIFVQWVHTYSMSQKILTTILSNLKGSFGNVTIFYTGAGDIAFFASHRPEPFRIDAKNIRVSQNSQTDSQSPLPSPSDSKNMEATLPIESQVRRILNHLHVERVSDLNFYEIYNSQEIDAIIEINPSFAHEIFYPKLNKEAYFSFYNGYKVNMGQFLDPMYRRMLKTRGQAFLDRERLEQVVSTARCKEKTTYTHFPCTFLVKPYASALKNIKDSSVRKRVLAYSLLRDRGLIKKDLTFIKKAMSNLPPLTKKESVLATSKLITSELLKEREYNLARAFIRRLALKEFIDKKKMEVTLKGFEETQRAQERLLKNLQTRSLAFSRAKSL